LDYIVVPAGFKVEIVASEPVLESSVAFECGDPLEKLLRSGDRPKA
jgi:hypothetical protein